MTEEQRQTVLKSAVDEDVDVVEGVGVDVGALVDVRTSGVKSVAKMAVGQDESGEDEEAEEEGKE